MRSCQLKQISPSVQHLMVSQKLFIHAEYSPHCGDRVVRYQVIMTAHVANGVVHKILEMESF